MKIQKQSKMIPFKSTCIFLLLVILAQTQDPTSTCPQLCVQNCTSTGSCSVCYNSFLADAANATCTCPLQTYKDYNGYCKQCPVVCQSCGNYSVCLTCIPGYMLSNYYSCIPNVTNDRGWVSINITENINSYSNLLNSKVQNLALIIDGQTINVTSSNRASYQTECAKLSPTSTWFGGYQKFSYSTKIIYSIFSLPPHQWINIRFQAILIDQWLHNTLQVQLNSAENYNPNALETPVTVWAATFDSSIRKFDLCGYAGIGDNLVTADIWVAHNHSSEKVMIRLNESDIVTTGTNTSNLQQLYFGVREFFIRVGTCGRNCKYCSSPTQCTQCYGPYVAVAGQCKCDASLGVGFPTETGCAFNCVDGEYYSSTAKSCLSCNEMYDHCQSCDSSKCKVCSLGYFYYEDGNGNSYCKRYCPQGYTQARGVEALLGGLNVQRDQCISCPANCLTCNLDICIFCQPGFQYHQGICLSNCPDGFFAKYGICSPCSAFGNCLNCTSQGCLTCNRDLTVVSMICRPLCYVNNTAATVAGTCNFNCTSPCASCYGSNSNECLSCLSGYLYDGQCVSVCPQGTFIYGSYCERCPFGCQVCSNSTICYSCTPGYFFSQFSCKRLCPSGTFPSLFNLSSISALTSNTTSFASINQTAYLNSSCLPCSQDCTRCLDLLTCFECKQDSFLFNFTCSRGEVDHYEWQDDRFRKCGQNCAKCKHHICRACQNGWFLNQGECLQECPAGKYKREVWRQDEDNHSFSLMVCAWKSPLCSDYNSTLSDGSCLRCSLTYPAAVIVSATSQDRQLAVCSFACPEFYTKTEALTCVPCPQNCRRCTPQMVCLKCLDNYVVNYPERITSANVMNETCLRYVCGDGQFSDSLQCQSCPLWCKVCLLDGSCYQCQTGYVLDANSKMCLSSACPQLNQFAVSSAGTTTCQSCSLACSSCYGTSATCTSCPSSPTNQTFLYNYTCTTVCPEGFFPHPPSKTCRRCDPRCTSCSQMLNCNSCTHDFYLLAFYDSRHAQCVAECPVGFWVNSSTCQLCYKDCKKCYGPSEYQCLECYPNFFVEEGKCVYQCGAMRYRDRSSGHCEWCHPSCEECWGPTEWGCVSCQSGHYYYDHICYSNQCPGATYLSIPSSRLCEPCQYGCQYCSSSQFCHFCTSGLYFYKGWCYASCPGSLKAHLSRYYNNLLGYICDSCQQSYTSQCARCDMYSCKRCNGDYFLYRASTEQAYENGAYLTKQCYSNCPEGTWVRGDGSRECVSCGARCEKCLSYSQCTECDHGYQLINGYCSSYCPSGKYQTSSGCYSCSSACKSCSNSTFCTSCLAGYSLFYSSTYQTLTCLTSCPSTYYADPSGWCLKCPSLCVTCTDASTCIQCVNGIPPTNGVCYNSTNTTCVDKCEICRYGVCERCSVPFGLYRNGGTGVSSCVSACPAGYYLSGFNCQKCNATCYTCQNTADNCTACVAGLFKQSQSCLAACPVGSYADPTTGSCQFCPLNCLNCLSSSCYLCSSGYFLYNSSCFAPCPPTTFLSPSSQMCFNCPQSCLSCTDIQNCTSCASGFYLYNRTCVEECPQGSYLDQTDTTGVCRTCAAPCYTCSNSLSCLSCVGGYILNGTACQELCGEGFYLDILQVDYNSEVDNQNFSMYGQCQPCSVNCQTCLNSSNNCLSCPTGLLLVSGTCVETCPPATITQNGVCLNCPPLCLQCSSTSSCQVCVSSAVLSNVTCFTSCPQGSYRALVTNVTISSATYNCTPCSSNCLTCEGDSQYSCLSCSQGYYFINGMCLVSCPSGTFPNNATGTCSYCPATCSQCSSFTNCQACVLNYSLTNTNQCQSPVPPNCTVQSCMSCSATSATWCEQCVTGFKRWNGSCLTACPQGTYNREGNCLACSANCTYCGTEGCRYCQTGNYLYQGYCYTVCPTGTKIEGGQCVSDPCQQYSNAGGCLSCANPYLLNPASQSCVLSCPGGTVGSSGQCVNCSFNCLSCVTPSSCAACNSSTNLYKGQCYFTCPIGTFVSEGKCVECGMAYCQQCSNSSSCTVCSSSSGAFLINSTCVLYCPAGTYKSQEASECVACSTGCSLCLNSSYCSSCQSPLALYQAQCLSVCPNGAYTSNGVCTPCPVGCYSCTSASNCSLCASGYLMLSSGSYYACVLSCPSGYFAAAMASTNFNNSYYYQCVTCFSPCQTCSQAGSTCTSCVSGYSLQGASCLSDCGNGYYPTIIFSTSIWGWTISIQICRHCPDICVTCSDSSTCTSCPSSYHLDQNGNCLSNCTQPNQYFELTTRQCLNCSSTCYTCKGPLVTDCLSCYPDYYLSQGSCLSQCPYGYYASSTYRCEACSPNCANCQGSATNCSACPTGGYLQLANGVSSCTVDCLAGYYRDTQSQTCSPCHSSCLNCTGKYPSQCINCPSNAYLSQGYCLTQCPLGSAPVVSTAGLNCLPCPSGCSVCTNTTSSSVGCTVCQSALYLSNGECLQVCPVGTYPSPESYTCRTCGIDGCYRCTYNSSLQVQCLTCQPGYYLLGNTGVCVTSCPSGYSLANSICVVDTTCRLYISNTLCLESCPQATYPLVSVNADNVTIRTCTACSVGCLNCESPTSCQQCVSGALRVTISSVTSCVSICPSGYYNSTGNCLACAAPCTQCYQSSTSSTVTCAVCASGYLLLNGQCLTACPAGYLASGSTCLPCASQCAECSASSSNCTVCKSASYPVPACVSQNCTGSQYQDISGNCLSCYAACSACFGGSSYECTSCSSGYFLLSGQCLPACPEGYVASGSACTLCPSHCLNCTASACSVCLTGYLMAAGQCVASCEQLNTNQVTYYTTASSCVLCNSTVSQCLVCSTSASPISCSQCQGGSYLYLGTCVTSCPGGFYLNIAASTCAACLANCTTCGSATTCTACAAGTVLSNGLCISSCSTGTYLSTVSGVSSCLPCSSHCLTCTASGCTSCVQPYTLISAQCTGCVSGYYFSSLVGICIKCSGQCLTCSVASTNCTTCPVGYYQYASSCLTTCPSGYYSSSGTCIPCSVSNCSACPLNVCTSCSTGTVGVVTSGALTCAATCPSATFLDATTNTCVTCSSNCQTCSSATSCTTCSSGYLYFGYCFSACPTGYNGVSGACVACLSGCKSCGPLTTCLACNSGLIPAANGSCTANTTLNCSAGYYANPLGSCSQCYPTCQTCLGALASNCLSCFDGATLASGVCVQGCSTSYFYSTNSSSCQLCTTLFSNCLSCTSTACAVCATNYTLSAGRCALTCPTGTYLSNQQCFSCSSFCLACTSATNCTSCMTGTTPAVFLYNGACSSSCPLQTYLSGSNCQPCLQTCLSCVLSASNCSGCLTPYNLYSNQCLVTCPNGTYSDNYACISCSANCLLCSGNASCTECVSTYYLIEGACRSTCIAGYYVDTASSRCLQCVAPCSYCTSRIACTACVSPYLLSGTSCISNCSVGAYYNSSLTTCVNCNMANCGVCTQLTCLACSSGYYSYYLSGVIAACIQNCYAGTYKDNATMNCSACFSYCQTCTNGSYCSLCDSTHYLLSLAGVGVNECVAICPLQYYQTLLRTCLSCGSNCNQCQNNTYCDVCQSNYYRYTSQDIATATNVSCVTQCPTGYANPTVISGTGLCILCPSRCLSCLDANTCTQCFYATDVIIDGQCKPSNCLNCLVCNDTSNICTQCVSSYFLYQNSCTAFCPIGYYPDYATGSCLKCMTNCVACFYKDTCVECINGYIFVNTTATCENEGYINFGSLGNMSGFTSNVTEIMATVYVSTSAGPIAFGALTSTYGVMQVCQFMYLMQGSSDGNEELNTFLNSLSIVSYTSSGSSNTSTSTSNSSASSRRRLTAIEYTSTFLSTNLPIFLMMIGFIGAYILVLIFTKYNESCCSSCPTIQKYIGYICQFMQKRFKFIYVDLVMWISYLPFLYFSVLQIKALKFDSGINALSSLIAFVIIVVYPLYPLFILRKIFDKSDDPELNLKNYKAITLQLPLDEEEVARRPLCADFQCCTKDNPDIAMTEMSLSPYIDKVVRPVYNEDVPEYAEFKYFSLPHWRLAYAALKYFRKFLFVLIVAVCPAPATTLGLLVGLSVIYMLYLLILKPKQKLYLVLEVILQTLILFFEVFMLIYVTTGGATVTALSIVAHAVGFALANSTLAIAIILNIMAYYTIFCCVYDLIKHMKAKVEEDDLNQIKQQLEIDEKDGFKLHDGDYEDYPEDAVQRDLEKDLIKKYGGDIDKELGIKKRKRGDDEATEENDDDVAGGHYDLDEKEFNIGDSSHGNGSSVHHVEGEDLPNLRQSHVPSKKSIKGEVLAIGDDLDKELGAVKPSKKKGDDQYTQQNDDDYQYDPMALDEKEFNPSSSMINKKKKKESKPEEGDDMPKLDRSQHRRAKKKESKKAIPVALTYDDNTEDDMAKSKLSNQSNPDLINQGLLKERERDRFKREVGGDNINVGKGELRDPTDKFRRGKGKNVPAQAQQESMEYLFVSPNAKAKQYQGQQVEEVGTNDRIRKSVSKQTPEGKTVLRMPGSKETPGKTSQLESIAMKERQKKIAADPFGEFQEIFQRQEKEPASIAMKQRQRKSAKDVMDNNLLFVDNEPKYVSRDPKSQKPDKKFYKGSEEQADIGEVQTKERKGNRFKRGGKHPENTEEPEIGQVEYLKTKKAEKKISVRDYAEDDLEELQYKERIAQVPHKKQGGLIGQQADVEQLQYKERFGQTPSKKQGGFVGQQEDVEELKYKEREKRKVNKHRPSDLDKLEEGMSESKTIVPEARARKPRAPLDDDFQEIDIGKQVKGKKEEIQRAKDNKLRVGQNLEESYDDVVKRNKEGVIKPKGFGNSNNLLDIDDDFQEISYDERPSSRMEKSDSKNKDTGLLGSYRDTEVGKEGSKDVRKRRNSINQKLRKKSGHLDVALGKNEDGEEMGVSQDSRRVSKILSKNKIKSGVLNIDDNSDADDLEEVHFEK